MPESKWGECKDCKWWQIEPGASVGNLTMGLCIDEKLQPFRLRVSGTAGATVSCPANRRGPRVPAKRRPVHSRRGND